MLNEEIPFIDEKNFDDSENEELQVRCPTRRMVSNVTLLDGLQPLTTEQLKNLTIGFHLHRERMDKKYGDDPRYFMFTRRNKEKLDQENFPFGVKVCIIEL